MLIVQACQQHRVVVVQPNKAKSFPAATMQSWYTAAERKRGTLSEKSRAARRAHASKQKCWWRGRGVLGVLHLTRRKNEGKHLGRKHLDMELRERRKAFYRKKRRGKRVEKKAARARSRLDELTFGAFNVRTAAVNGANSFGHSDTLLRPCAAKGCDVIGLQESKRDGTSRIEASGYRVYFSGGYSGVKYRKGQHGVGLAKKEEIVKKAGKNGIAIERISARIMETRVSIQLNFVTFVVT